MNLDRKGVLLKVKEGADHLIDPAASGGTPPVWDGSRRDGQRGAVGTVLLWAATADGAEQKPPRSDAPNLIRWDSICAANSARRHRPEDVWIQARSMIADATSSTADPIRRRRSASLPSVKHCGEPALRR